MKFTKMSKTAMKPKGAACEGPKHERMEGSAEMKPMKGMAPMKGMKPMMPAMKQRAMRTSKHR